MIHFNFGLHDLKFLKPGGQANPPAKYEANLRLLVARMEKTGAKLIWASTTPVPEKTKPSEYPRVPAAIGIYNAVAARIMAEHGIATDDLYAAVLARQAELQNPLDVHFNSKGCDVLGRACGRGHQRSPAPRQKMNRWILFLLLSAVAVRAAEPVVEPAAAPVIASVEPRIWSCDFQERGPQRRGDAVSRRAARRG